MTFALVTFLAALQAPVPVPAVPRPPVHVMPGRPATPPIDWVGLPELPYSRRLPQGEALSAYVRAEVEAGRCDAPRLADAVHQTLRVELAVYVAANGTIRRVLPRAIGCPTVEQYASGIVSQVARGNVDLAATSGNQWFRTAMVFSWPR